MFDALLYGRLEMAPDGWWNLESVKTAFGRLFRQKIEHVLSLPPRDVQKDGDGAIICGGGGRYAIGTYVTAKMIRHFAPDLPIEVWHLAGEEDDRLAFALSRLDAKMVCGNQFLWNGKRVLDGWSLKCHAVLNSRFRNIAYFDADSYPVAPLGPLFDYLSSNTSGAMFFLDGVNGVDDFTTAHRNALGLDVEPEAAWESGQFFVDSIRAEKPLLLANWLNEYSIYVFRHVYGDKETFHAGFLALKFPVWLSSRPRTVEGAGFVHFGPDGQPIVVHRISDKFRRPGERFYSGQIYSYVKVNHFLPGENLAFQAYEEALDLLGKTESPGIRRDVVVPVGARFH